MKLAQIQFSPWDKIYYFDPNNLDLAKGDKVVVKTELGIEIGAVAGFIDKSSIKINEAQCDCPYKDKCSEEANGEKEEIKIKPVLRKATKADLEKQASQEKKNESLDYCKKTAVKLELPIKLVDVHFSFDGSCITFAFIADNRIDFRELVKDLVRHFSRTIRLQQIGVRDEAKISGDYGHCGRRLCCQKFLIDLTSITSEMAEIQQCAHRGSERISGICGRLMCCLSYENNGYKDLAKKLPAISTKVNVDGQRGVVVGHHILKQSVDVEFPAENGDKKTVVEVDLNRKK